MFAERYYGRKILFRLVKAKKNGEKKGSRKGQVSGTLKKLIEELSSETSQDSEVMEKGTGGFFDQYNTIINMEGQEEVATRCHQIVL